MIDELKSGDPERQTGAIAIVRDIPGETITKALADEMPNLSPPVQVQVLSTLADRGDASALGAVIEASMFSKRYDQPLDRRSAYEMLNERAEKTARDEAEAAAGKTAAKKPASRRSNRQGVVEAMLKSIVRSIGSSLGRQISRGVLGSILKR